MFSFQINSLLRIIAICFPMVVGAFAQQNASKRVPIVPFGDHHTHILSINAAELGAVPIPPAVELPEELTRLLRDKERLSQQRTVAALKDLYTEDALVQDVGGPYWLQGERAVRYVAENTVMARLVPTAFHVDGTSGYVAGIEVVDSNGKVTPASNFLYVIRKGADGKWRVAVETFTFTGWPLAKGVTPEELIAGMDAAGIERASVLSVAYWYGSAFRETPVENEYAKVRAENDWVAEQTSKFRGRLNAYFSFNPLKDYAIEEIERCAKNPAFKGIKLHLGNGKANVLDPDHITKLRAVFAAANKNRLPVVVHLWTVDRTYGAPHSKAFLEQVLPSAPDIPIQIAHMTASGPGYHSDDAMEVFANAAADADARMKNVYFDAASMVIASTPPATLELVAKRLRQVGMKKVLFGSDWVPGRSSNESPQQAWASFRRLPLTDADFKTVASNAFPERSVR